MIIEEAATGKEVHQKIEHFLPDLIFMDIKLPDGSGLQLTQEIKSTYPKIKIIILTNYNLPEYRDAALKHGANYFLCKSSSSSEEITKFVEHIVSGLHQ
jgi:DNA-binding NarL/FixJ family response regulator